MEAATAAPEQTSKVAFVSTDQNLRLVKDPADERLGKDGRRVPIHGKTYEFKNGELLVDSGDSDALTFLREHDANGSNQESTGTETLFWERGSEPDRPSPDSSGILREIVRKTADGDADGLADLFLQERSSYSRPEVLAAATTAIEALEGDVPAPPQTPEHEVERVRAQPAVGDTPGVQPLSEPAREGQSTNPAEPVEPAPPVSPQQDVAPPDQTG